MFEPKVVGHCSLYVQDTMSATTCLHCGCTIEEHPVPIVEDSGGGRMAERFYTEWREPRTYTGEEVVDVELIGKGRSVKVPLKKGVLYGADVVEAMRTKDDDHYNPLIQPAKYRESVQVTTDEAVEQWYEDITTKRDEPPLLTDVVRGSMSFNVKPLNKDLGYHITPPPPPTFFEQHEEIIIRVIVPALIVATGAALCVAVLTA